MCCGAVSLYKKAISKAHGADFSRAITEDPAGIVRRVTDRNCRWRAGHVVRDHIIEEYLKPMSEVFIWEAVLILIKAIEEENFEPLKIVGYDA